jgi:hypothetical protein
MAGGALPRREDLSPGLVGISFGMPPISNSWIRHWFSAKTAQRGGIIRRDIYWVQRHSSLGEVKCEASILGWHVVLVGEQVIVICNAGEIKVEC